MYVELLFILDFWINLLILIGVSICLKRKIKLFNLFLASFIGSISLIIIFLDITKIQALILKVYFSIIMILISFYYKNFKYFVLNLGTFYFLNILFGGFFYLTKLEDIYNSIVFLFISSPILIYIYIRQFNVLKRKNDLFYDVCILIGPKKLNLIGFLDSGNNLVFKNQLVIITNLENVFHRKKYYIPYNTISSYGLLECIRVDKVILKEKEYENVLLGFNSNFNIEGADVLLNNRMEE